MPRLTKEQRELLRILAEDKTDDSEPESAAEVTEPESEEFVVFRGSPDAFFKAFGMTPPPAKSESNTADEASESETDTPKEEPKARTRSKYFG